MRAAPESSAKSTRGEEPSLHRRRFRFTDAGCCSVEPPTLNSHTIPNARDLFGPALLFQKLCRGDEEGVYFRARERRFHSDQRDFRKELLRLVNQTSTRGFLFRAEHAVAGITETRNDIAMGVEVAVDGSSENVHIRMDAGEMLDPFRGRKQGDEFQI